MTQARGRATAEFARDLGRVVEHRDRGRDPILHRQELGQSDVTGVGVTVEAQAYAERALRLDRYSDSRYVRLSELLAMQDRVAAAIAVLDDAAEVARELGGGAPSNLRQRRTELVRRAALR